MTGRHEEDPALEAVKARWTRGRGHRGNYEVTSDRRWFSHFSLGYRPANLVQPTRHTSPELQRMRQKGNWRVTRQKATTAWMKNDSLKEKRGCANALPVTLLHVAVDRRDLLLRGPCQMLCSILTVRCLVSLFSSLSFSFTSRRVFPFSSSR